MLSSPPITVPYVMASPSLVRGLGEDRAPRPVSALEQAREALAEHGLHPSSRGELTAAAVEGMLHVMQDPYGQYLAPRPFERLLSETEGIYVGIGVEIRRVGDRIVLDPVPGGPAARAGLQRGSVLVAVDGRPLESQTPEGGQNALEGAPGTTVRISVLERGRPRVYAVRRGEVLLKSVSSRMLGNHLGYVRVSEFGRGVGQAAAEAAQGLAADHMRGWILDLRDNPGGFLGEALTFLNGVAKPGETVRIDYRDRHDIVEHAPGPGLEVPVVILVNRNTASAAELVAAALRRLNGAKLMGERTYGKAYLQEVQSLGGEGGMVYTVARAEDAQGRSWQGRGLAPDMVREPRNGLAEARTWLLHGRRKGHLRIPGR